MLHSRTRLFPFVLILLLASLAVGFHLSGTPYRYDETWLLAAAANPTASLPLQPLIPAWISVLTTNPIIVRWLFNLFLMLGLAILARLAAALYGRRIMRLAPIMMATLALWSDFGGRATSYALTATFGASLYALYWLWAKHPRRLVAGAYIACGILMALTYPAGISIIVLQLIFTMLILHRPQKLWLTGLALLAGAVTVILVGQGDSIVTVINRAVLQFNPAIHLQSGDNIQLLLLIGLAASALAFDWQENRDRSIYLLLMIGGALIVNAFIGMQLNLLFLLLMPLVVLAAHGLLLMARPVRVGLACIYLLFTLVLLGTSRLDMPAYPQMADRLSAGKGIVISSPTLWQQAANLFYIRQRIPDAVPFHIVETPDYNDLHSLKVDLSNVMSSTDNTGAQRFLDWAVPYDELWLVEDRLRVLQAKPYAGMFKPFVAYTIVNWMGKPAKDTDEQEVTRFIRVPQNLQNQFAFGDQLWLQQWILKDDVNARACQTITVQSWWQLQTPARDNYSLSLTLSSASDGQGAAQVDSALGKTETLLWEIGQPYFDERLLTIPCDLASGDYNLLFTAYSSKNNQIAVLDAALPDGSPLGKQLYLTTLHIQSAS